MFNCSTCPWLWGWYSLHELFWSLGMNTTLQEHGSNSPPLSDCSFSGQPYWVNIFCRAFDTIAEILEVSGTSQQYFEKQSITDKIIRKLCADCWTNGLCELYISNKSVWTHSMTLKVQISLGGGFCVFRAAIFFTGAITICFDILNHLSHNHIAGRNTLQLHWSHLSYMHALFCFMKSSTSGIWSGLLRTAATNKSYLSSESRPLLAVEHFLRQESAQSVTLLYIVHYR